MASHSSPSKTDKTIAGANPAAAQKTGISWRAWATALLVLILGALVFKSLHALLADVHYRSIVHAVRHTPVSNLLLAVLATAVSYLSLAGYDVSSLRYVGAKVKGSTIGLTSFIAYALGNTVGLGVLTGGTVRMRLYTASGVEASQVAQAVAFNASAFGLGMSTFGALGLLWGAPQIEALAHIPSWLLRALASLLLLGVAGFMVLCKVRREVMLFGRWNLRLPEVGLALRQLLISAVDLSAAAATLWFLLPGGVIDLPTFVAFYAIAMALGVISHVPGGVGVFEAVILLACANHAPTSGIAAALLLYRSIYFLLPLLLATILLAAIEIRAGTGAPVARAAVRLSPWLLTALTLVTGTMLLVSGVTPATRHAEELLRLHVPLFVVEASHLIGSVAGLAMLFLARGLLHRLDAAWWASLVLTIIAGILALPKGIAVNEFIVLFLLASLLVISRKQFDRRSSLFSQTFEPGWLIAVACVLAACGWILLFAYRDIDFADRMWWQFAFDDYAPRSMRTLMVVAIMALGLGLWQLFRRSTGVAERPGEEELQRAAGILRKQPAADACLALMGDKSLLFSASGNSFIMYAKHNRSWVALSDPVGEQQEWSELIWRFIELADGYGGRAAFYKVRPQSLPLYLDAGLRVYKLGEEAYVPLDQFSLQGPRRANLRHGVNRAEREGLSFEIVAPAQLSSVMAELKTVSDAWLADQDTREKGFSLGGFDQAYILRQPVAVIRRAQKIIAFASLMCPDVSRVEAAIDLMRQLPDAPPGTMDFLFSSLMLHFKEQGFQRFGLGMAPMSGMKDHQLASRWHRFGRILFMHGGRFYNFRGLRNFKDKFDPVWEARYLVSKGGLAPIFTFTDTAALISGGLKGAVSK
ncbi:bifunctional lysylphosphatidylglycerol flippase/synthetase MprF [Collimonas humicola]|uniref:bifunctional lysylphosphatidylglycerol flippase/synthetase MprF n=1 Tax=Collimonas humicola TaxID=2825886 RepID=UPI001B8AAE43|nr:bifunctional lysylphosphatidylglycerol flippase/synthetase MprF [Collimonas humicola]